MRCFAAETGLSAERPIQLSPVCTPEATWDKQTQSNCLEPYPPINLRFICPIRSSFRHHTPLLIHTLFLILTQPDATVSQQSQKHHPYNSGQLMQLLQQTNTWNISHMTEYTHVPRRPYGILRVGEVKT